MVDDRQARTDWRSADAPLIRCARCRQLITAGCTCTIPLIPESPGCIGKERYTSRLAAESGLATRRAQWRRDPQRAALPPVRFYRCPECDGWHLTSAA